MEKAGGTVSLLPHQAQPMSAKSPALLSPPGPDPNPTNVNGDVATGTSPN